MNGNDQTLEYDPKGEIKFLADLQWGPTTKEVLKTQAITSELLYGVNNQKNDLNDFAFFRIPPPWPNERFEMSSESDEIAEGDEVYIMGYPGKKDGMFGGMYLYKSSILKVYGDRYFAVDIEVEPGVSGAPIIHAKTLKVIGLAAQNVQLIEDPKPWQGGVAKNKLYLIAQNVHGSKLKRMVDVILGDPCPNAFSPY